MELPNKIKLAITSLHKLPGVGEKSAMRHILNVIEWSEQDIREFASSIAGLTNLTRCIECGMISDLEKCSICCNTDRYDQKIICVVEGISDLLAIENSGHFRGLFHILGGVLNPLLGIGPAELQLDELIERARKYEITEIILALNPSVEGDATCSYIKSVLSSSIKVDRIGFGIPMGGSLEYLDSLTISKALENRKMM